MLARIVGKYSEDVGRTLKFQRDDEVRFALVIQEKCVEELKNAEYGYLQHCSLPKTPSYTLSIQPTFLRVLSAETTLYRITNAHTLPVTCAHRK